ncbi:hypothetical protein WMY93_012834 [Mugilogobius chulae]|uniref:C-type lectin domain-containing protein n=1 Tax=Mugilogobius chulae TaxID=88201 RepID=A0AAW0NZW2_9GOBI
MTQTFLWSRTKPTRQIHQSVSRPEPRDELGLILSVSSVSLSSYRLLSVEPEELKYVHSYVQQASTSKVWVGLRFLGGSWFWSDGGAVSLSLPECPQSGLHCGALVVDRSSGSDLIEPSDCSQSLSVLCYGEP